MRILFAAGMACAACALVQCKPRQYNQSETKSAEDVVSMEKDASGTYTVTCKNGTKEYKVAMSQIQSNEVCKAAPPQGASSIIADFNGTYTVMCKDGTIEHAVTKARVDSGDYCGQKSQPAQGVTQVNPKAFNAFDIWNTGSGAEILDYPQGYNVQEGETTPDGVFYVRDAEYRKDQKFVGVPTEGAKVVNNVLEYPVKNGKQLKLKFIEISANQMKHLDAVTYCKNKGMRLPTIRELFDFCAAGVTEPKYGPNYESGKYPPTARCGRRVDWSASVYSNNRPYAWLFDGNNGPVIINSRSFNNGMRCAGEP